MNYLLPTSENVRVSTHFTYSGTFVPVTDVYDTYSYSMNDDRFTEVIEETNPQNNIEARSIAFATNLPFNEYEDNYVFGTIVTKEYSHVEYQFSVDVECDSQFVNNPNAELNLYTTFNLLETSAIVQPFEYWATNVGILLNIIGVAMFFVVPFSLTAKMVVGLLVNQVGYIISFIREDSTVITSTRSGYENIWVSLSIQ